jgi:hypothetical protein
VKCLHIQDGELKLKKNDNYHYQIQMQMAVSGLSWCVFFVWLENESHLETVYFDISNNPNDGFLSGAYTFLSGVAASQ